MKSIEELLKSRLVTAEEAVAGVRSGDRVLVGSGCAEPPLLVEALKRAAPRLNDVEIVHLLTLGGAPYVEPEFAGHFRHNAFFIGANVRKAVSDGRADYTPVFLSEIPALIRSGQRRVDVALLTLSAPDRHGYCSMGIHVDIQRAALETARVRIAEINPRMPRTFGDTTVHLSELDHVVQVDRPLFYLEGHGEPDDVSIQIGGQVARLIGHGACLQMGIGAIPDAVLRFLRDKHDLGVHTEMFSDGLLHLLENGNVTNRKKAVHRGKTITSFAMGSEALYRYVDDNPSVAFYASDYVNDPRVICRNDNVVAVNSALQVDLSGQICADSLGYRFYSGIGGQVDFIRGAAMSKGGKPIIALPSTAKDGTVSRIVPHLDEGAGVVTSRGDVHYVATEYGVAYLHGKTIRERALALIGIAHPDFRQGLLDVVKKRHYVYEDEQIFRQAIDPYPAAWAKEQDFGDARFRIRPLKATDERRLQELFYSHLPETVYARYFHVKTALGHREAAELCCVDYTQRMAFGVFEFAPGGRLVAVGRYDLDPRAGEAETAVVVHESFRRRGIARFLTLELEAYARSKGVRALVSMIHSDNVGMVSLHRELGHELRWSDEDGCYVVRRELNRGPRPENSTQDL
jgi:acyl-CoA hydrolase/GNAT superfamily N-acetyltransferase